MAYESIDRLQKTLAETVFTHTKDAKKASGRALGTLIEIITFYLLKSWGFEQSIAIERSLPEYGNPDIAHNVEFSLHPVLREVTLDVSQAKLPLSASRLMAELAAGSFDTAGFKQSGNALLSKRNVLRNACIIGHGTTSHLTATLKARRDDSVQILVTQLHTKPYAMLECKRVGVEEGTHRGPQTIEKAKQGAYVARAVSALQKNRDATGASQGVLYRSDGTVYLRPYSKLIGEVIRSEDAELLRDFVLTVGVVSNHGNWFTSDNHNKELKVLAQSYDWLLFLTDAGLSEFIHKLLLEPAPNLRPAKDAFLESYDADSRGNEFTKVKMRYDADQALQAFFRANAGRIETWFNMIQPNAGAMEQLRMQLSTLRGKNWTEVHRR